MASQESYDFLRRERCRRSGRGRVTGRLGTGAKYLMTRIQALNLIDLQVLRNLALEVWEEVARALEEFPATGPTMILSSRSVCHARLNLHRKVGTKGTLVQLRTRPPPRDAGTSSPPKTQTRSHFACLIVVDLATLPLPLILLASARSRPASFISLYEVGSLHGPLLCSVEPIILACLLACQLHTFLS